MHDRDNQRIFPERVRYLIYFYATMRIRLQIRDLETLGFQIRTCVEDRFVLNGARNDVSFCVAGRHCRALDRKVVRLSRTRGPNDLSDICVQ